MREMKDSGIEWIKQIPAGWITTRGKNILQLMKRPTKADDEVITCFRDGEVTLRKNRREEGFTFSDKETGYQGIKKGDIVIHGMDGFAGAIGISDSDGKSSPVLVVCTTKENSRYLVYYLRILAMQDVFLALATGIRERSCDLRWNKIADLLFPIPGFNEQCRIANYLDTKCAKIDAIIARQQQVIAKLKAYKLSVITETVTKGLNPNVPMKDSGIEWIGSTPIDWKILKFGLAARVSANLVSPVDYLDYPQISPESVEKDSGRILEHKTVAEAGVISWNHLFVRGQIIYSKIRPLLNKVAIAPFDGLCSADMYPIDTENDPGFITYVMRSCYFTAQVGLVTENRVKMPKINQSELSKIMITLPPLQEQVELAEYLDKKCKRLDHVIEQKQALIDKLTQYKKSLIYEVVTGKREIDTELPQATTVAVVSPELLRYMKAVLMARLIDGLGNHVLGRVQVQKGLYFAETSPNLGLHLDTDYARYKHGPYDREIQSYEAIMAEHGWIYTSDEQDHTIYRRGEQFSEYWGEYQRLFPNCEGTVQRIIDFVKQFQYTKDVEKVATLFAAWNDFIIDGVASPTDEKIIAEARYHWTKNKRRIKDRTWRKSLAQLKSAQFIPQGHGKHTVKWQGGEAHG